MGNTRLLTIPNSAATCRAAVIVAKKPLTICLVSFTHTKKRQVQDVTSPPEDARGEAPFGLINILMTIDFRLVAAGNANPASDKTST